MEYIRLDLNHSGLKEGDIIFSVKTGIYYKVTGLKPKVKLQQIDGEDIKELSASTLQRWYRLVRGYEVPETTTEEVAVADEPVQVELPVEEVIQEEVAPEEVTPQEISPQEVRSEPTNWRPSPKDFETEVEEVAPTEVEETTEPPVQTSTTATTQRKAPNSQPVDPVIQAVREDIINTILAECPNSFTKQTGSYTGLRVGKNNFGEVTTGKKRFSIRVISKSLTPDQVALCNIAPPSYGWTLDATFTVLTEQDKAEAVALLKSSFAYRVANTTK